MKRAKPFVFKKLVGCARCGGTHLRLKFKPFTRPPAPHTFRRGRPSRITTHFARCPKTTEPILLDTEVHP